VEIRDAYGTLDPAAALVRTPVGSGWASKAGVWLLRSGGIEAGSRRVGGPASQGFVNPPPMIRDRRVKAPAQVFDGGRDEPRPAVRGRRRGRIFMKLHFRDRAQAVVAADESGLVQPGDALPSPGTGLAVAAD